VNQLAEKIDIDQSTAVVYIYFDHQKPFLNTVETILRNLIKQLCWHLSDPPKSIMDFFRRYNDRSEIPAEREVLAAFLELCDSFKQISLVVDGLDECQWGFRGDILKVLNEFVQGHTNAKILVISRYVKDIETSFEAHTTSVIQMMTTNVQDDIKAYVRAEVDKRIKENRLRINKGNRELRDKIIACLSDKADGMYDDSRSALKIYKFNVLTGFSG